MELFEIDVIYIIATGIAWFIGSYLFWVFVARPMFKKWVKSTILLMVTEPDADTKLAINSMFTLGWNWFLTPVETGRVIKQKDEEGNETEVKEAVSPYNQLISETARIIFYKFKAQTGGMNAKLQADLSGLALESAGLGISPAAMKAIMKGNFGPAIAEVGFPKILEFINNINKKKDISHQGGGSSDWK